MTNSKAWDEPKSALNSESEHPPVYPYVNATYTESGHSFIMNDTPNGECIRLQHRNESFLEFHPNGDIVVKAAKGNNYVIISNGNNNVSVSGDYNIETAGDFSLNVKKDFNQEVNGDYVKRVKGNVVVLYDQEAGSGGGVNYTSNSDFSITSSKGNIVLNCSDYPGTNQVIINGNLLVNGTIKAQGNITSQCNVTANESIFGMISVKTLGSLHVGPSAAITPNVPIPGMGFFDVGVNAMAFFSTPGIGLFGGMTMSMDAFYGIPGTTFSTHIHVSPLGPTSPPL